MAEYIDAELLMQKLSRMIDYCEKNKDKKFNALNVLFQVGDAIMDCPTADVVPKSEVDAVASNGVLQLHDYYFEWQEAVREIENLKVLLEMKDVSYAGLKELYDTDTAALIRAREKTEVEVAREIFEDADKIFMANCLSLETYGAWLELKKKYTEGERS